MVLFWNKERYQRVDTVVSVVMLAGIAGFMYAWYFDVLPGSTIAITILPVGLAHWYKRKLEKLLKTYGGAQVTVDDDRLTLSKPNQDYEAIVRFHEIRSIKSIHWLFLEKMSLSLKGNREIELVNFCDQKAIQSKINACAKANPPGSKKKRRR